MADGGWFGRVIKSKLRGAGRTAERSRAAYTAGKTDARQSLPTDDDGRARIVCRRYAEERAVEIDDEGRPECFDGGHADCRGCAEDVRDGRVETW